MTAFTYSIAHSNKDRAATRDLITAVYTEMGYINDGAEYSEISDFLFNREQTTTILAHLNNELIGTISLVRDGKDGLPMDSIYAQELAQFRAMGKAIAEVCQFAVNKVKLPHTALIGSHFQEAELAMGLLALALKVGTQKQLEQFVFAVNPKHSRFYETLGAARIGMEKIYTTANNNPAVGYALNLACFDSTSSSYVNNVLTRKLQRFSFSGTIEEAR